VIGDSGARILITETAFLDRAMAVRDLGSTALETIVCVDGGHEATLGWDELLDSGSDDYDLEAAARAVEPTDLLTLIYTSGTTGPPKGVELTHANVMAVVAGATERLGFTSGIRAISWLPMAHIAERLCTNYIAIAHGWQVTTCADPRAVAALLAEVRPEFFFSPPRPPPHARHGRPRPGAGGPWTGCTPSRSTRRPPAHARRRPRAGRPRQVRPLRARQASRRPSRSRRTHR
jgi:long-subunit acyl-CoA synthetase (AMP-forming)